MYAFQYAYARKTGMNLPIYQLGLGDKFEDYVTTKKDQKEGIDKKPMEFPYRAFELNRYQ